MNLHEMLIASKLRGGGSGGGGKDWFNDGNTHIWISLQDGRTSPMVGLGVNGTVTVDWGDGSEPDVLTGTSTNTVKYTPAHEYEKPGDYVITLSGDGEIGVLGTSSGTYLFVASADSSNSINKVYINSIQKVELGSAVTSIGNYAFMYCYSLSSVHIPESTTSIGYYAFSECYSLSSVHIPESVMNIGSNMLYNCYSLSSVYIPASIPSSATSVLRNCCSLASVHISEGTTIIADYTFYNCHSLSSVYIPASIATIGNAAFQNCRGMKYFDFTNHTAVPKLDTTTAFSNIPSDCEIRVPATLVDEWKAATNWSTYADYIVGV